MCRQHKGQKVIRTSNNLSGDVLKGSTYTIKYLIDDDTLALEEVEGSFRRSEFEDEATYVKPFDVDSVSVASLTSALRLIDMWNRTRPTALMVSIEAYPAQDGGSLFTTDSFDSNEVNTFMSHLINYASSAEKADLLEQAATALRFGA